MKTNKHRQVKHQGLTKWKPFIHGADKSTNAVRCGP